MPAGSLAAFAAPPARLPLAPRCWPRTTRRRPPPRRPSPTLREVPVQHSIPRPDGDDAAFIPQTIEYALRQAHAATAHALVEGHTNLRVELPMGRTRKHWYRMSPMPASYTETALLAFHYATLFTGLCIHLVLTHPSPLTHPVPRVHAVHHTDHHDVLAVLSEPQRPEQRRVLVLAALRSQYKSLLAKLVFVEADAIILLNSFLEEPLVTPVYPFVDTYIVRALQKSAVMRARHDAPWHVFTDIAVFEYEWVGNCDNSWRPTQRRVENFALQRDAKTKAVNGYWHTPYAGCEAVFWTFMTLACRELLPLDGRVLDQISTEKKQKAQRPFGFF
eukprot:TRINITY_DN36414_c0_g1_i1.p1 TRINITY_DN36414_c0_g1~~TRINITY_DN36414_c0_g1_i1.p1  ORF type:complete len:339 (-),score=26.45 TRINITY_DN36414_c0_g1_i1:192-1187(-)